MIFWFSGTGNSKYAAQRMAEALNEPLLCMNDRIKAHDTAAVETGERPCHRHADLCLAHSPPRPRLAAADGASGREAGVVRHDLRRRDRQRRSL